MILRVIVISFALNCKSDESCRYVEAILRNNNFGDRLIVVSCKTENFLAGDENFDNEVLRKIVSFRRTQKCSIEKFQFVWKSAPDEEVSLIRVEKFKREVFMYTEIIPFYKMIEEKNNLKDEKNISNMVPILHAYCTQNIPVILLEDIQEKSYYVTGKKIG